MPPELPDPMIIDDAVLPVAGDVREDAKGIVGLPTVVEDASESPFKGMSPEEAAAEISELAGLPAPDAGAEQSETAQPEEVG